MHIRFVTSVCATRCERFAAGVLVGLRRSEDWNANAAATAKRSASQPHKFSDAANKKHALR